MKENKKFQDRNMEKDSYECCVLCPRKCKVNRNNGEWGYCRRSSDIYVARAALHMWEEPCISGYADDEVKYPTAGCGILNPHGLLAKIKGKRQLGSGAVFFAGCNLGCVYCQNIDISREKGGVCISVERLAQIFLELQEKGAGNINLVTPTHYAPSVVKAIQLAKEMGCSLPIVYNSSGYEEVDTLKLLEGSVDIYLPDLKYRSDELAGKYSFAPDYFSKASKAIEEMYRQTGPVKINNENGFMERGVIVRHLVLPGCVEDSKNLIRYLFETYKNQICISIMNQYTPMSSMKAYPELNRKVTKKEYESVVDYAIEIGVENGFIQEGDTVGESFIPQFNGEGVL